jgi:uncharacterized protein YjaZ
MKFLLLLLPLFVSCGVEQQLSDKYLVGDHDNSFNEFIYMFEDATGHEVDVPIYFGDSNGSAALCSQRRVGGEWYLKQIIVWKAKFERRTFAQQYHVIAHELVHCQLEVEEHDPRDGRLMSTHLNIAVDTTTEQVDSELAEGYGMH